LIATESFQNPLASAGGFFVLDFVAAEIFVWFAHFTVKIF